MPHAAKGHTSSCSSLRQQLCAYGTGTLQAERAAQRAEQHRQLQHPALNHRPPPVATADAEQMSRERAALAHSMPIAMENAHFELPPKTRKSISVVVRILLPCSATSTKCTRCVLLHLNYFLFTTAALILLLVSNCVACYRLAGTTHNSVAGSAAENGCHQILSKDVPREPS
jgi:hypothetical protein